MSRMESMCSLSSVARLAAYSRDMGGAILTDRTVVRDTV